MNTWSIALKELKATVRNKSTFIFMLAFPIALILILGTALSNAFTYGVSVGDMRLLVKNESANGQLAFAWGEFAQAIERQGVRIEPLMAGMNGPEEVQAARYSAYAEVGDDGIKFYGSSKQTIESNIVQGMLTAFANRYALIEAALHADPETAHAIMSRTREGDDFIHETTLNHSKQPSAMGYYAIAVTTMIALYSGISASNLFRDERTRKTAIRLTAAPVSKWEIFAGKVIGCTVINLIGVLATVLFSKFVFHADWGEHYGMVLLVLSTEVLFAVSLGLGVSFLVTGEAAQSILFAFAQVASFIGGAYFPIPWTKGFMNVLTNLSPLRWANTALTQIIYAQDLKAAVPAIGLNVGISAIFLIIAVIAMRRREAL